LIKTSALEGRKERRRHSSLFDKLNFGAKRWMNGKKRVKLTTLGHTNSPKKRKHNGGGCLKTKNRGLILFDVDKSLHEGSNTDSKNLWERGGERSQNGNISSKPIY